MKDLWQDAFDQALEAGADPLLASKLADDEVADCLARQADAAYDHWRDDFERDYYDR